MKKSVYNLLAPACLLATLQFSNPAAFAQGTRPAPGGGKVQKGGGGSAPIPLQRASRGDQRGKVSGGANDGGIEFPSIYRTIDGTGNHLGNPDWGSAGVTQLRLTTVGYGDGAESPSGANRPSARAVSNACASQTASIENHRHATDYLWQWGQFVDHDIDETPGADPSEAFNIPVPAGDPHFDPFNTGTEEIPLSRSTYTVVDGVRQQENHITAFIDASNVYGSDSDRAEALRTLDGTGKLKTSDGDLLPYNDAGFPNAEIPDGTVYFLAGDVRANEQVGLTAMHTLFVREHNFWADTIAASDGSLSGDEVYEMARAIVGAEMQSITYNEFLPILLGPDAIGPYQGFRSRTNPGIANVFAAAAYRVGHTMLSTELLRLDANGNTIAAGNLSLADAFFEPGALEDEGIDSVLRGLAGQACQEIDNKVIDDVRNFLFGPPGAGGFDLASLNIQRGRDHGLPSYSQVRRDFGLQPARSFADIGGTPEVATELASVYASVDDIDPWVGMLAERHVSGAMVGETLRAVLGDQFGRLRDGDRFWYENSLTQELVQVVEQQTLARIIQRNTGIGAELQDNVFLVPNDGIEGDAIQPGPSPGPGPGPRPPRNRVRR